MNRQPQTDSSVFLMIGGVVALTVGVYWLLRLWVYSGRTGDPIEDHSKRMRRLSWLWPIPLMLGCILGMAIAAVVGPTDANAMYAGLAMTTFCAVGAVLVHLSFQRRARNGPPRSEPTQTPAAAAPPWTWVFIVALIAFVVWLNVERRNRIPGRAPARPPFQLGQASPLYQGIWLATVVGLSIPVLAACCAGWRSKSNSEGRYVDPAVFRRRMRFRGFFWPIELLLAGVAYCLLGVVDVRGNLRLKPDSSAFAGFLVYLGVAVLTHLYYRARIRVGPPLAPVVPLEVAVEKPSVDFDTQEIQVAKPVATSRLGTMALVLTVALAFFLAYLWGSLAREREQQEALVAPGWACLITFAAIVGVAAILYYIQYWQTRDAAVIRAARRARDGDVDGAIAELEHELEARGPSSARLGGLAGLYLQKRDYANAAGWIRKSLAIEPQSQALLANLAFCLFEMGADDEADAALAKINSTQYADPGTLVWLAKELLKLGRTDAADVAVNRAVHNLDRTDLSGKPDARRILEESIAEARQDIARARIDGA